MGLKESEEKLSELNAEINRLLKEREIILKEWNVAFNTENPEDIICVDESIEGCHRLYLVNNESKMHVCLLDSYDMAGSLEDFNKRIDTSMCILNVANGRDDTPEYQKISFMPKQLRLESVYKLKIQ